MTTFKVKDGMDINVISLWFMSGWDLDRLLIDADNDARHDLAIVDDKMMPYAVEISVMAGEIENIFYVKRRSHFMACVIVFADSESELRYLSLRESSNFCIKQSELQNN